MEIRKGRNFTSVEAGAQETWGGHVYPHPRLKRDVEGKLFLKELLGLTGMEVSLNRLPARSMMPFNHRHRQNEELYLFLKGSGEFMVDGEVIAVGPGTVIRVGPEGSRTWRNRSEEELYYVVIQARGGTLEAGAISDGLPEDGRPRWPR